MGVPLMRTKTWAYAIGAFFGGVAGAYYASFKAGAFPADFYFNISIFLLCMVILGGMGSIWGVIVGGVILALPQRRGPRDDRLEDPGRRARLRPDEVPVRDLRGHHRADDAVPARGLIPERRHKIELEEGVHDTPFYDVAAPRARSPTATGATTDGLTTSSRSRSCARSSAASSPSTTSTSRSRAARSSR